MNKPNLQDGDLIFIAIPNPLYRQVAEGTGSKASHVGIVLKNRDGDWMVAESTVPFSRYLPLEKFIRRSDKGWYCIRRLRDGFPMRQLEQLRHECDRRMGILYHPGFKFDSRRLFCSKFVYEVFRDTLKIEIGQLETFRALLDRQPETPLWFWRLWYFGRIPWSRRTVTPASQMETNLLRTVYESPA